MPRRFAEILKRRNKLDKDILRGIADSSAAYLASLPNRPVAPSDAALKKLASLRQPLPEAGVPLDDISRVLEQVLAPATLATAGPRFFGFVTGACHPAALIANWFAGTWDQNVFSHTGSPAGAAVEQLVLGWLIELFGLDPNCGGSLVTGGTLANFSALAAARNELLRRSNWDLAENGLAGAPKITIVVGQEAHPTLLKSLRLLGFGENQIIRIATDSQGRMNPAEWPKHLQEPVLLCLQAGNVNTGAFDPAKQLIALAREYDSWVHVDGAFGLWAAAVPSLAHLAEGIADADSWAVDGHKWLNVPYDCGIALVKDQNALRRAVGIEAPYLPATNQREPFHYSLELSRRMRAVEIWAVLKFLGRAGLIDLIEKHCYYASLFANALSDAGFTVLNDVILNQVLVSFGSRERTLAIVQDIQSAGVCWCGPTVWKGTTAMRISVSSWATSEADIEASIESIVICANKAN